MQEQLQGNRYVGIHIQLSYDEKQKQAVIQELVPGGPADRAGGKKGDRIEQIDGADTQGMKLEQVVDRLRGPVGTELTVTVRQPKEKEARTLKMTRETLFLPTVVGLRKQSSGDWDLKVGGPDGVAYLRIKDITASTPHELRKLAQQFDAEGLKALILDLRDLSNASLHPTVLLADSLLERGTIGRVRTADRVTTHEATPDALFRGRPIAVLVDRGTVCGAEWLAAALQDNHRATDRGDPDRQPLPRPGTLASHGQDDRHGGRDLDPPAGRRRVVDQPDHRPARARRRPADRRSPVAVRDGEPREQGGLAGVLQGGEGGSEAGSPRRGRESRPADDAPSRGMAGRSGARRLPPIRSRILPSTGPSRCSASP